MTGRDTTQGDCLLGDRVRRLDALCDRFEADWAAGREPRIEEYLIGVNEADRGAAFLELLGLELELRAARGERPDLADYLVRFPADAGPIDAVFREAGSRATCRVAPPARSASTDRLTGTEPTRTASGSGAALAPAGLSSLPGYEVLGELGRGGMGVVYLARQVRLNRLCALKMILDGRFAGPEAAVRFLAEAETVAALRHPNVVQIHALGDHEGVPFVELEYLEGGSLAARLDNTPWPPREAAKLVEMLARALAEVHRLGVVHRDLKPSNVLLTADGTPKIADFGVSRRLGVDSGLTRTDAVLGSPSYMAPEQAGGSARAVGPAADLYALGAIFYELITGRPPFRGATVLETLEQVKEADPVAPSRLVPRTPRDVDTVAMKCLRKEPAQRYATAEALAEDLRRVQAGEPVLARRAGPVVRLSSWARRNRGVAALSALLASLLALGAVLGAVAAFHFRAAADRADAARRDAVTEANRARRTSEILAGSSRRQTPGHRRPRLRPPRPPPTSPSPPSRSSTVPPRRSTRSMTRRSARCSPTRSAGHTAGWAHWTGPGGGFSRRRSCAAPVAARTQNLTPTPCTTWRSS
ncbi:MAG: serine/threonine-protein kinase [Isosphaeraceae bacterium]